MGKNGRPVPGSRAEVLLDQILVELRALRADLASPPATEALTTEAARG